MIRARQGTAIAALGLLLVGSGCATRGMLNRSIEEQNAALEAERRERMAADQRLGGDVQVVASNVSQLRTDLAALDTDFGAKIAMLEEGMQIAMPVNFAFDAAEVRPEVMPALDRFIAIVQRHYPTSTVTVEGFTDPAGSAEYNRRLATNRAEAVKNFLIQRGLPTTQVRAVGYGEDRLVVPGAWGDTFGAELNRRVVFVIETPSGTTITAQNSTN
jgi:peptidoglycan-associated lipoprotein